MQPIMTDSPSETSRSPQPDNNDAALNTVAAWLDAPAPLNAADELPALLSYLAILRSAEVSPARSNVLLNRLYERVVEVNDALLPLLREGTLPIPLPRKTRLMLRNLQDVLQALSDDFLSAARNYAPVEKTDAGQLFWRSLNVQSLLLSISHLTAAPAAKGAWQQLHQTYERAVQKGMTEHTPGNSERSLEKLYFSALLLGGAQPATFTSKEVDFTADLLDRLIDQVDVSRPAQPDDTAAFWIESGRDAPATACARKAPPPATDVRIFSCRPLADRIKTQLGELETGKKAADLGLPDFADTVAGRGVLRRLASYWGEPGKRRFPRRRQNYRAVLCLGLDNVWRLFRDGGNALVDTSSWMIINESPDGYAVMHVSGKTGILSVGDVLAIRTESGESWQTCIVRWALSENQEHLELGLQILSTQSMPAVLAQPSITGDRARRPVLVLPKATALRDSEWIVAASGALNGHDDNFVLVIEKGNIEVREARRTELKEQNGLIEVFVIEPVNLPAPA